MGGATEADVRDKILPLVMLFDVIFREKFVEPVQNSYYQRKIARSWGTLRRAFHQSKPRFFLVKLQIQSHAGQILAKN